MVKEIKEERLAIVATLSRPIPGGPAIVECRVDYTVGSSDGLIEARSFVPTLTASQEKALKDFAMLMLKVVKKGENIAD